jgi:hypothetical protein
VNDFLAEIPEDKLKPIAETLCNGQPHEWAIDRLQRYSKAVRSPIKTPDDKWDRKAFEGALNLQMWLMLEARACDKLGQDCPPEIDDIGTPLAELLPLIARYIRQPGKRGPSIDWRKHICAWVCASIWEEFHDSAGSNSDTLLAAW